MKKIIIALIISVIVFCCLLPFVPKSLFVDEDTTKQAISYQDYSENDSEKTYTYIANTNTKKFHTSYCRDAKMISDKNKKTYICTRDELISKGYSPCKHCCP